MISKREADAEWRTPSSAAAAERREKRGSTPRVADEGVRRS